MVNAGAPGCHALQEFWLNLCSLILCSCAVQHGFFDGTRFPSDRRPVRVANMQLALDAFARAGLPLQVCVWPIMIHLWLGCLHCLVAFWDSHQ